MFYVSIRMSTEIELTKVDHAHGIFTENRQYPVLDTIYNPAMGMQLLIPDNNGMLKYYQMDMCVFASLDGEPATKITTATEVLSKLEEKPKMGRPKKVDSEQL